MNLSNSSQVSQKQTFTTDFIKAVNLLALTLVPVAVSASLEKPFSYPGKKKKNKWDKALSTGRCGQMSS